MKIVKFGGKSLQPGRGLENTLEIIKEENKKGRIAVVVSAIGETTDLLEKILELAKIGKDYKAEFSKFKENEYHSESYPENEFRTLERLFRGVALTEDCSPRTRDLILAQGELISSKILSEKLRREELPAIAVDARNFIITDNRFGNAKPDELLSEEKTKIYFSSFLENEIPVVTGFIGFSKDNETVTLGRNGSNFTASLLAKFLNAKEVRNYTHVNGIYTANPEWVPDAKKIRQLNFEEAGELANLGADILHSNTIYPLTENRIPLRILNTLAPEEEGTLVSYDTEEKGICSIACEEDISIICLRGRGLLGTVGTDARIFSAMAREGISVGLVAQGTTERGVAFAVKTRNADDAVQALNAEFSKDLASGGVDSIKALDEIAVISIVGQDLSNFDRPYAALVKNNIVPVLFSNTAFGKNVSIAVKQQQAKRALNVIHGQIFGVSKKINLAVFGHGTVGGTLIDQILSSANEIEKRKGIRLNVFAVANSRKLLLDRKGIGENWRERVEGDGKEYEISDLIRFAEENHLENLIAVDNTASSEIIGEYMLLAENGFDLVSSNKKANSAGFGFYRELRKVLTENHREYLYETNVGAGLPLIDTIGLLHLSGENITRIRGVFSGSLSYIFNHFSVRDEKFNIILNEAVEAGLTEPDPREDLSGNDVGRKLLILARELDLENEFEEIKIQNLVPQELEALTKEDFLAQSDKANVFFDSLKRKVKEGHVLKYVGELSGNLKESKGVLETGLVVVPADSPLGNLGGADSLFEIYTESYGERPLIIQGAGAGAEVTARGVFGDILRLASGG